MPSLPWGFCGQLGWLENMHITAQCSLLHHSWNGFTWAGIEWCVNVWCRWCGLEHLESGSYLGKCVAGWCLRLAPKGWCVAESWSRHPALERGGGWSVQFYRPLPLYLSVCLFWSHVSQLIYLFLKETFLWTDILYKSNPNLNIISTLLLAAWQ